MCLNIGFIYHFYVPVICSAAPEWAETINNTQIDIGSEHTMRCVASGKPFPFIRWYKDGYMVREQLYVQSFINQNEITWYGLSIWVVSVCFPVWERGVEVFQSHF